MLEKPDIPEEKISAKLQDEYGLRVAQVDFLPLGADQRTAVYRVVTDDASPYFCKLRSGIFDETCVSLPKFLADQGIAAIIAPLPTNRGQLWASLDKYKLILYPFVEGRDGYEIDLSDKHWIDFGAALKRIHAAPFPSALVERIPHESWSPKWREALRIHLDRVGEPAFGDDTAAALGEFLIAERETILDLVGRADRLAQAMAARKRDFSVCHSDLHAGNILIDPGGELYIVDWDDVIQASKERDLMFAGGGQFGAARTPREEEALFYRGYGQTEIDPIALAYYRYERIVQDLAIYCEQIIQSTASGPDRELALRYFKSNFLSNNTIEIAYASDRSPKSLTAEGS
jgi:spectinomycin phosphotransferase